MTAYMNSRSSFADLLEHGALHRDACWSSARDGRRGLHSRSRLLRHHFRENNLKQIEGGRVLESQGVLVASRTALLHRAGTLEIIHEMLERLEATAPTVSAVTANVRGSSAEEVATRLANDAGQLLGGLQAPTISSSHALRMAGRRRMEALRRFHRCAQDPHLRDGQGAP